MTDWLSYWNTMPASLPQDDVLRQVGKTVGGEPVPAVTLEAIVADIAAALSLDAADSLLDLCCGNGVITARCAAYAGEVTGVDFSAPLIRIANDRSSRTNVSYVLADVRSLPAIITGRRYSKILMYEAIQHLAMDDVELLLGRLRASKSHAAAVFFGSIPDRDRMWTFYDSDERREDYFRRVKTGTEAIGHWWTQAELSAVGRRRGYSVGILRQTAKLHTAHYRFDALLTPIDANA